MGINPMCRSSDLTSQSFTATTVTAPNPNPRRFTVVRRYSPVDSDLLVLQVFYPDCTTHGGRKVMVYEDKGEVFDALAQSEASLDPHFLDDPKVLSPIARFPGNDLGWRLAHTFADHLANKDG